MSDIGETWQALVPGGEAAIAARRRGDDGKPAEGHTHESACLNCGTALVGAHCHGCGQRSHVHRTLRGFAHDLLHGVLHFEARTEHAPLAAWRTSKLTRELSKGSGSLCQPDACSCLWCS